MKQKKQVNFQDLLTQAVNEPGQLMAAYRAFHNFSLGNQMLAVSECRARGIPIGPLATFKKWDERGRKVLKGSKAISLFMPVTLKKERTKADGTTEESTFSMFKLVPRWFVLSQTDGEAFTDTTLANWNQSDALKALEIEKIEFSEVNGNIQGYAIGRKVAVNPLAQLPLKTLFHEMAHVLLGHTESNALAADHEVLPSDIKEVEAESVAMLCLASLDLPGVEFCRGYIQNWIKTDGIPEKSCRRIMGAADKILKAGTKGGV